MVRVASPLQSQEEVASLEASKLPDMLANVIAFPDGGRPGLQAQFLASLRGPAKQPSRILNLFYSEEAIQNRRSVGSSVRRYSFVMMLNRNCKSAKPARLMVDHAQRRLHPQHQRRRSGLSGRRSQLERQRCASGRARGSRLRVSSPAV